MRYAAITIVSSALVLCFLALWRAGEASNDRDTQPADFNDVVVVITIVSVAITAALLGVTLAVLS